MSARKKEWSVESIKKVIARHSSSFWRIGCKQIYFVQILLLNLLFQNKKPKV